MQFYQVSEGKISFEDTGDEGSNLKKPVVICIPGIGGNQFIENS